MHSGLWFCLTLVAASYLNINYEDKMQLHQSMPYSCLSEVKHCLFGGLFFLSLACLPWAICGMSSSHLIRVQFKGRQLGLLKDHVFLRAWCAQKLPAMQSSCMFSPKDLL